MYNEKESLVHEVIIALTEHFGREDVLRIRNVLCEKLQLFDVHAVSRELIAYNDTNNDILKSFVVCKTIEGLSPKTLKQYGLSIRDFLKTMKNKCLKEIDSVDVQYFLAEKMNKGLSRATLDNNRRILSTLFSWMVTNGHINTNPVDRVPCIKMPKSVRKPFSHAEIEKLRAVAPLRERAIIEMLLATGCRVGEIVGIKIQDIDFVKKSIVVLGKGNKERTVFYNESAAYWMNEYLKKNPREESQCLFQSMRRKGGETQPLTINALEWILRTLGRKAKVENTYPHRFRHTFATMAAGKGMQIDQIQHILGHSQIKTTSIYIGTDSREIRHSYEKYCQ
ncbi:tyrosine-type recombinase/integrase [Veillonellaceae bacterium WCA-693-APC-5D-A]|uniref:Tyrosine-type recombinase/integrase n=1 Tax=Anaerovibrio slackiae TaxID=2652309 RepID=A0A6I2UHZ6_9FIRM|nr:tyrosine-type recombinase/integrase [Anaerovibrio slackiae]MSU09174.1 tyrosine-type recombinase/integrase [Anaerovibrio slackiae]